MKRLWRTGEPFIWITGGALCLALLMVAGLIGLILVNGLGFFWPAAVTRLTLGDGKVVTGQIDEREAVPGKAGEHRIKLKVANRDLYGADFVWIDESQVSGRATPPEIAVIERTEWGALIGTIREVRQAGAVVLAVPAVARAATIDPLAFVNAMGSFVRAATALHTASTNLMNSCLTYSAGIFSSMMKVKPSTMDNGVKPEDAPKP